LLHISVQKCFLLQISVQTCHFLKKTLFLLQMFVYPLWKCELFVSQKGHFSFFCPFFPCRCVTSLPGSLLLSFLLLFSVRICHFYIKIFLNLSHFVYFIRHNTTFSLRMLFYQRLWNITLFLLHISVQICHLLNRCLVPWYH
jgi:hypothetical protein